MIILHIIAKITQKKTRGSGREWSQMSLDANSQYVSVSFIFILHR